MKHIRAIVASPKTSVPGIVMILGALGSMVADWRALFDANRAPLIVGGFVTGCGLLLAADSTTEDRPKPQEPPKS